MARTKLTAKKAGLIVIGLLVVGLTSWLGPYLWNSLTIDHYPRPEQHFQAMLANLLVTERVGYIQQVEASSQTDSYLTTEKLQQRFIVDYSQPDSCQLPTVNYSDYASCFEWQLEGSLEQKPLSPDLPSGILANYQADIIGDGQSLIYQRYRKLDIRQLSYPDAQQVYPGFDSGIWKHLKGQWISSNQPAILDSSDFNDQFRATRQAFRLVSRQVSARVHAVGRAILPTQNLDQADQRQAIVDQLLAAEIYYLDSCHFSHRGRYVTCQVQLDTAQLIKFYQDWPEVFGSVPRVLEKLAGSGGSVDFKLLIDIKSNLPKQLTFNQPTSLGLIEPSWSTTTKADFSWQFNPSHRIKLPEKLLTEDSLNRFRN